ncbi:MAG: class I SAM-dependent methyltransferase [Acidobacteriota bacterium]|nr:class I SAM-dependent methyltransferase [Acidobacteriota bacterium]
MERLIAATARAEREHFWFRGLRRFVAPLLARAATGTQVKILDCGCGTGANLTMLAHCGRSSGVDREWTGVQRANEAGRPVSQADVARLPFGDSQFDLTTSFDVLYCLEPQDERAAVAEMFRVLRPGGHAIINVAAMPVLRGNHSVLAHELRRYTAPTLRTLVETAGFVVDRVTYTNATMLPVLLPLRIVHRWCGLAAEADAEREIQIPIHPVNWLLDRLLALESQLLRVVDLPCGSSLLLLARKPVTARRVVAS